MSNQLPVFNLNASNLEVKTQADLDAELNKTTFARFTPGNYDFAITAADFHKNKDTGSILCAGDETWFNVVVTLTAVDGREMRVYLQIPTSKLTYGAKKTYMVYKKLINFMAGVGRPITIDNQAKVIPATFTDPSKLVGIKVNADVGYEGPHTDDVEGGIIIKLPNGKAVEDEGKPVVFPDYASARAYAEGLGINLQRATVVNYTPGKAAETKAKPKQPVDEEW